MFISELHIQGYKRLRDATFRLGPLTVLIGPNGVGKTSFLESLRLLADSARKEAGLADRLVALGGLDRVISRDAEVEATRLVVAQPVAGQNDVRYTLELRPKHADYEIQYEELSQQRRSDRPEPMHYVHSWPGHRYYFNPEQSKPTEPDFEFDDSETALSQIPAMYREPEAFRRSLARTAFFKPVDTGERAPIRLPQQVRPARMPDASGADLVSALQTTRSSDPDAFDLLETVLRTAYSGFERLEFAPVAAGQMVLTWRENGQTFYANELSEGTLRFVWLATLLLADDMPALTMIDEPEVSLHPELLKILSDLLDSASRRTQLVVATQSPELVSWLKPEQVTVVDLDEGGWAKPTSASEMDLGQWLERYTLGQLWTRGVLGGRP